MSLDTSGLPKSSNVTKEADLIVNKPPADLVRIHQINFLMKKIYALVKAVETIAGTNTGGGPTVVDAIVNGNITDAVSPNAVYDALALKQDLDSDLTAIAGLTPANDDVIQRKAGAWVNRTMAQLYADLGIVAGVTDHGALTGLADDDHSQYHNDTRADTWLATKDSDDIAEGATNKFLTTAEETKLGHISVTQAVDLDAMELITNDTDITTIAGLSPSNDDVIQRKAGAWSNRTMAQLAADLVSQLIASAITNGDTSHSPSGDVIFDQFAAQTSLVGNLAADTIAAGATSYWGIIGGQTTDNTTENLRELPIPYACTLDQFYVRNYTGQNAGGSLVLTVRKNAVDTALTVTVAAGTLARNTTADTTNVVTFAAGDLVCIKAVNNYGGGVSATVGWTLRMKAV